MDDCGMDKEILYPPGEISPEEYKRISQWTREEALEAHEKWCEVYGDVSYKNPLLKWLATKELKQKCELYLKGDKKAILEAVLACVANDLPIPAWCAKAFEEAFLEVRSYKARSWDDVFGAPHPKGTNLAAKRKKHEKAFEVYERIKNIRERSPSTPIDACLFEEVGKEFNLGKTLTEEYYYSVKNGTTWSD